MRSSTLRSLLLAAACGLFAGAALAGDVGTPVTPAPAKPQEEKSLLAPDGTLYTVRSGQAVELGLTDTTLIATDNVIAWSFLRPDGSTGQGLVPDTVGQSLKRNLELAYDEPTGSLVLLFKEDLTVLNILRLGILKNGAWSMSNLLPNLGFAHAYNPQILLSHPTVTTQDSNGILLSQTRTILSVIWWEEAQYSQARYAPIFLDEVSDASDVQVYDLPALVGGGISNSPGSHASGAYMYPSLQLEGIGGGLLASFADLAGDKHYVIRIKYPENLGKPGPDNVTWQRRRIPVVGVASESPIPTDGPIFMESVKTVIGSSYRPTLVWSTAKALAYTRFDGRKWSPAITIPLTDTMTYDRALRLVQEMATRN
jgi:hypothetical protein